MGLPSFQHGRQHISICTICFPVDLHAKEPNILSLQVEKLPKNALDKYKIKRRKFHEYKAAVRLWGQGVDFEDALQIVESAFDAAMTEADN